MVQLVQPFPDAEVVDTAPPTHNSISLTHGAYAIRNGRTKGSLHVSGTTVVHWKYTGEIHQKWIPESGAQGYKIKHAASGLYLSLAPGVETTASTEAILSAHAAEWEIFRETESHTIVLAYDPRYVLDLDGDNVINGSKVIVNPKAGKPNQIWFLESVVFDLPQKLYSGALELGTYHIRNWCSKGALDLYQGKDTPGSPIFEWGANGDDSQKWILEVGYYGYKIKNAASRTYLSFAPGVLAVSGSPVTGNPIPVEWIVERHDSSYVFVLALNVHLALELSTSGASDDTKIIVNPKTGNPNQDWILPLKVELEKASYTGPFPTGVPYRIRNVWSKKAMNLMNNSPAPGTQIANWTVNGYKNQSWILEAGENGYRIKSAAHNDSYLGFAQGVSPTTRGSIISGNPTPVEWTITYENNLVFIHLASDSNLVLDLAAYNFMDGAKIVVWPKNGGKNQAWIFEVTT